VGGHGVDAGVSLREKELVVVGTGPEVVDEPGLVLVAARV